MIFVILALILFHQNTSDKGYPVDIQAGCLATTIYKEARGEHPKVRRAVYDVVLNRANYQGKTICEVVKQPRAFSWYRAGQDLRLEEKNVKLLTEASKEAKVVSKDTRWFYSGVAPEWAKKMRCRRIGKLNFCKEKAK